MFWFKGCPRCSGDLYQDQDQYGPFITCMQCGFSKDTPGSVEGPLEISVEPVPGPSIPRSEGDKRRRLSHGGRHFSRTFAFGGESTSGSVA